MSKEGKKLSDLTTSDLQKSYRKWVKYGLICGLIPLAVMTIFLICYFSLVI
nr:MAG: hypothetical protein [uncultured archaeon]BDI55245.1 MAG: hypothetical protein [uncultured archaeon]